MTPTVAQILKMPFDEFIESEYADKLARKFNIGAADGDDETVDAKAAMRILKVRRSVFRQIVGEFRDELQPRGKGSHGYSKAALLRVKKLRDTGALREFNRRERARAAKGRAK